MQHGEGQRGAVTPPGNTGWAGLLRPGGQLPSVRAAAEAEVQELRTRALSIADRALDVVEDALEDNDPQVRLQPAVSCWTGCCLASSVASR